MGSSPSNSSRVRLRLSRAVLGRMLGGRLGPPARPVLSPSARAAIDRLVLAGDAYPCYCTEEELAAMRARQGAHGEPARYERRCLSLYAEHRADYEAAGRRPAFRFRVPQDVRLPIPDLGRPGLALDSTELEDFVVMDRAGRPGPALAAVLDRAAHGVTHLLRDLASVPESARELLLYDALGLPAPCYAHLGPARDPESDA